MLLDLHVRVSAAECTADAQCGDSNVATELSEQISAWLARDVPLKGLLERKLRYAAPRSGDPTCAGLLFTCLLLLFCLVFPSLLCLSVSGTQACKARQRCVHVRLGSAAVSTRSVPSIV
jgi:hypothetical protein